MSIVATVRETIGTVTYLRPDFPIAGVSALASFTDDSAGTGSYTKTFRYSLDGVQYSDWASFTNPNLASIVFDQWDIFVIELAYDSSTGTGLTISEATITGTITEPTNNPIFAKSLFPRLLDEYDPEVIGWYVSVVQKLYGRGLLAKYIQKTNVNGVATDFIAYWSALAKFFAYFVIYARRYQDMYNNIDLLGEFLRERGLAISVNDTLPELQFIARNYYAEIMKRGTIRIIDGTDDRTTATPPEVYGEFLRLIYYNPKDEFLFNLYRSNKFGWNMGNSSPLYRGISYENNSVNKYRNSPSFPAVPLKVNNNIPYEICFAFQAPANSSLQFQLDSKDALGDSTTLKSAYDGSTTNNFVSEFYPARYDKALFYRLVVYPYNTGPDVHNVTSFNNGNNLIFDAYTQNVRFRIFTTVGETTEEYTNSVNFVKMFPLNTDYSRGFLQAKNFISVWLSNNNKYYTTLQLEAFIKKYLIPYDSSIKVSDYPEVDLNPPESRPDYNGDFSPDFLI